MVLGWTAACLAILLTYLLIASALIRLAVWFDPQLYTWCGGKKQYYATEGQYGFGLFWPITIPLGIFLVIMYGVLVGLETIVNWFCGFDKRCLR